MLTDYVPPGPDVAFWFQCFKRFGFVGSLVGPQRVWFEEAGFFLGGGPIQSWVFVKEVTLSYHNRDL